MGGWNGEGESLPRAPGDAPQTWGPWLWQGRREPELLPLPILQPTPQLPVLIPSSETYLLSPSEGRSSTMKMRKV